MFQDYALTSSFICLERIKVTDLHFLQNGDFKNCPFHKEIPSSKKIPIRKQMNGDDIKYKYVTTVVER